MRNWFEKTDFKWRVKTQNDQKMEYDKAQDEVASDEAQDGSQQANQSKNTFKYKSSHPKDQIIGNKDSPRRTRSYFI